MAITNSMHAPAQQENDRVDEQPAGSGPRSPRAEVGSCQLQRICVEIPAIDPWSILSLTLVADEVVRVAWHDPRTSCSYAALGAAATFSAEGPRRFATVRHACDSAARRTVTTTLDGLPQAELGLPFVVGGFAFGDSAGRSEGPWKGWPAAWMIVPRVLLVRRQERCYLVLAEARSPVEHKGQSLSKLAARAQELLSALERVSAVDTSSQNQLPTRSARLGAVDLEPYDAADPDATWLEQTAEAAAAISGGSLDKLVLARSMQIERQAESDALRVLGKLRELHGDSTVYAVSRGAGGVLVGATPETLIELRGVGFRTAALAGTAPRREDRSDDDATAHALCADPKERGEHQFVVRAITEALRPLCSVWSSAPAPIVHRFKHVQHLETPIIGELRQRQHVLDLVGALHPTPAVGGWPSAPALRWLDAHERVQRGWYAGPVGWASADGSGHFAVALRCALLRQSEAWAYAGAGLTALSEARREWVETNLKLRAIADLLRAEGQGRRDATP